MSEFSCEDWEYYAEGNQHMIYKFKSKIQKYHSYRDRILRIPKSPSNFDTSQKSRDETFLIQSVLPLISETYITHDSSIISITGNFIRNLISRDYILRPAGRRFDFSTDLSFLFCCLEKNLTYPKQCCRDDGKRLTVDIKVKCGFKSRSPFTPESRAIKIKIGRYKLMQLSKLSDAQTKSRCPAWGMFHGLSDYDPLDLQSRSPGRIQTALAALLLNAQNNIRILSDGVEILGPNCTISDALLHSILENFFFPAVDLCNSVNVSTIGKTSLTNCLAQIFCTEDIMWRVKVVQSMDVIDVEGASTIFEMLISMVGSKAAAEEIMLQRSLHPTRVGLWPYFCWLASSRCDVVGAGKEMMTLDEIQSTILSSDLSAEERRMLDVLMELQKLEIDEVMSEEMRSLRRAAARSWLSSLTKSDCVELLHFYLLALMAKDLSAIVTLEDITDYYTTDPDLVAVSPKGADQSSTNITQEDDHPASAERTDKPTSVWPDSIVLDGQESTASQWRILRQQSSKDPGLIAFFRNPPAPMMVTAGSPCVRDGHSAGLGLTVENTSIRILDSSMSSASSFLSMSSSSSSSLSSSIVSHSSELCMNTNPTTSSATVPLISRSSCTKSSSIPVLSSTHSHLTELDQNGPHVNVYMTVSGSDATGASDVSNGSGTRHLSRSLRGTTSVHTTGHNLTSQARRNENAPTGERGDSFTLTSVHSDPTPTVTQTTMTKSEPIKSANSSSPTSHRIFSYSIGVVDVGPKPPSKLWKKETEEHLFCSRAQQMQDILCQNGK